MSPRKKTAVPQKAPAAKETYWTRLEKVRGAFTLSSLAKAAHLGSGTLINAQKRGVPPSLEVTLAICRVLGIQPAVLLGQKTPAALQPQLGITAPEAADSALRRIPLANLTRSHLNPRRSFDEVETAELAESIVQQGLLQNLVVRQDADQPAIYWIVAGERRLRALQKLAAEKRLPADLAEHGVPCRVIAGDDSEHIILALLENLQRVNVNPMEEAEALARLHATDPKKWSAALIAARLGVHPSFVQRRIKLAGDLTDEAKESLRNGQISIEQAKVLASVSKDAQAEMLEEAIDGARARDLARQAAGDMFEAKHALFDFAERGLETWEDPDSGDLFITNFDAALKLQANVVEAKRQELLAAGRPWVDVREWINEYNYPKGGQGAVIVFSQHTGRVEIFIDRSRREEKAAEADDDNSEALEQAQTRYNNEHGAAATALIRALTEQMTYAEARAVLLWNSLMQKGSYTNTLAVPTVYTARVDSTMEALAELVGFNGVKASDPKRILAAWQSLLKQPEGRLQNAVVSHVANSLDRPRQGVPLHSILAALADTVGHKVPAILLDDKAARTARIKRYASGQADIEDAIAEAAE